MQAQFKVRPNLIITVEGDKQTDLFRSIASAQEVFSEEKCGKCQSTDLTFRTRKDKEDNEYFEMVCDKCHAVLAFGCHKKGNTLFPKRTKEDDAGETQYLPNSGWQKWNREKQCLE